MTFSTTILGTITVHDIICGLIHFKLQNLDKTVVWSGPFGDVSVFIEIEMLQDIGLFCQLSSVRIPGNTVQCFPELVMPDP